MQDSKRWLSFFAGVAITTAVVLCGNSLRADKDMATTAVIVCAVITLLVVSGCIYMAARAWEEVNRERRHFNVIKEEVEVELSQKYAEKARKEAEEAKARQEKQKQFQQNSFEAGYCCGYRDCQEGIEPEYTFND